MLFAVPRLATEDLDVLGLIKEQNERLRYRIGGMPERWTGTLRRHAAARALQGSNSIEGIHSTLADAVAIIDGEPTLNATAEDVAALEGYRNAMTYVISLRDDPHARADAQLLRALHYMVTSCAGRSKRPGRWRNGSISIHNEPTGDVVYRGPEVEQVPGLMAELCEALQASSPYPMVDAATAHLNLVMIHPFTDGNGRMSRAVQALVLAWRERVSHPVFCSIEEWIGRNALAYYTMLGDVGRGAWHPENDALPWLRFCLVAHYQQASVVSQRADAIGRLWNEVIAIRRRHHLDERIEQPLVDAALGHRVTSAHHATQSGISGVVAGRDLRRLAGIDLLAAVGDKRGRYYEAGPALTALSRPLRERLPVADPYQVLAPPA